MAQVYVSKSYTVWVGRQSPLPRPEWETAMNRAARYYFTGWLR
jgi:hypothetical protein